MRKRTVTTIEMHQIAVVRRAAAGAAHVWCPACLGEVEALPVEAAALLAGVSLRDVCRRIGDGDIHLVETADGGGVCLASLLNQTPVGAVRPDPDGADVPSSTSTDLKALGPARAEGAVPDASGS